MLLTIGRMIRGGLSGLSAVDLFLVVGQSNAEGRGSSASSPSVLPGAGWYWSSGGGLVKSLADPVGGANTGSMWPSFANQYYALTGRTACLVEEATGGSALIAAASATNWSATGSLRSVAVASCNSARAAIIADGEKKLGGVYVISSQGEQDAVSVNGTTVTGAIYKTELEALASYFAANITGFTQMGVVRTGAANDRAAAVNWAAIRQAQEDACAASANLTMLYRGTSGLPFDARRLMADSVHYNQTALNEAGRIAARGLSAGGAPTPVTSPQVLGAQVFGDIASASTTSITGSFTPPAGTKAVIVAAIAARIVSNTTFSLTNVTFGGVAMAKANASFAAGTAAANASPACYVNIGLFTITEAQFGGDLTGAARAIVVTPSASSNVLAFVAVALDADFVVESGISASANSGTVVSVNSDNGAPVTAIAVLGSSAASSAALTTSLAGGTWTELADGTEIGASNGTRSGQALVAHAALPEGVTTVTATISASINAAIMQIVGLRSKVSGE